MKLMIALAILGLALTIAGIAMFSYRAALIAAGLGVLAGALIIDHGDNG